MGLSLMGGLMNNLMKVLVTGADGQLGLSLVEALRNVNWIDLLFANKQELDITDAQQIEAYFQKHRPDVVINAAAFTAVNAAEDLAFEAAQVNHIGAANLAGAAASVGAVIIQLSTDYVFSGDASLPYIESDPTFPVNVYGKTKLAGERVVAELNSKYVILRTSWLFGEKKENFYLTMAHLLETKKTIDVVSDQVGAPTYVLDVVGVIIKMLSVLSERGAIAWGIYHYSGYPFVSWFDFAKEIQRSLSSSAAQSNLVGVSTAHYGSVVQRPLYVCLDSSKACDYFSVQPSDWRSALNRLAANRPAINRFVVNENLKK